ncbi:hypothetical protein C4561_04590 [candidate division WWE3 bacterium]|jgi:oxalate decarboxylase/phosphoglucose isomerase-like protein (cupin superfamily)|uniref:glucose-6-phosphate isomerase n=1 Tax=candidate division WWE3 bacterium TaxID=2053526 RepID=A0A3A4ZCQ4_UNCKA|nr:MAG: hypothetical protein C4561_04590 [candidate division WWE3 bacterium]
MQIKSTRTKGELAEVLMNSKSNGPDVAYWVFSEISQGKWENMTVTTNGFYDSEFPKTYGHYHGTNVIETYMLVSGKGILQLQKKLINGPVEKVERVFMIQFEKSGEQIQIPFEWGHSWSNVGNEPLITFDDWRSGHTDSDYEIIKRLKGMSYYLVKDADTGIRAVPNENYKDLPEPEWITPEQFEKLI